MGCSSISSRNSFANFTFLLFIMMNGSIVVARVEIFSGQSWTTGQSLDIGLYRLTMQTDCNLVLYVNRNRELWSSGTSGKGTACSANLLTTGNLVVLDGNGVKLYGGGTLGEVRNYVLVLQGDGNVVTYPPAVWNTDSSVLLIDR